MIKQRSTSDNLFALVLAFFFFSLPFGYGQNNYLAVDCITAGQNPISYIEQVENVTFQMIQLPNPTGPASNCSSGNGMTENTSWISFIASSNAANFDLDIMINNCSGQPTDGIEWGIVSDCNFTEVICDVSCSSSTVYSVNTTLNSGQQYWLWLDGCNSNACEFQLIFNEGLDNLAPCTSNICGVNNTSIFPQTDFSGAFNFQCLQGCMTDGIPATNISYCGQDTLPTVWYRVVTDIDAFQLYITVETNSNWTPIYSIYNGNCTNLNPISSSDSPLCNLDWNNPSSINQGVSGIDEYWIAVSAIGDANEIFYNPDFEICVSSTIQFITCLGSFGGECEELTDWELMSSSNPNQELGPITDLNPSATPTLCPGETIEVCGSFTYDASETGVDWMIGMVPMLGEDWDLSSFDPVNATVTGNGLSAVWYDDGTSTAPILQEYVTQLCTFIDSEGNLQLCNALCSSCPCAPGMGYPEPLPGGWFWVTTGMNAGCANDGSPGEGWGIGAMIAEVSFCFELKVRSDLTTADCASADLAVGFHPFSDGVAGCWEDPVGECLIDESQSVLFNLSCANSTYYSDNDGDGYGDPNSSIVSCSPPQGFVSNDLDCNDLDANLNPLAVEICDGIDNNCNGQIDEGLMSTDLDTLFYAPIDVCLNDFVGGDFTIPSLDLNGNPIQPWYGDLPTITSPPFDQETFISELPDPFNACFSHQSITITPLQVPTGVWQDVVCSSDLEPGGIYENGFYTVGSDDPPNDPMQIPIPTSNIVVDFDNGSLSPLDYTGMGCDSIITVVIDLIEIDGFLTQETCIEGPGVELTWETQGTDLSLYSNITYSWYEGEIDPANEFFDSDGIQNNITVYSSGIYYLEICADLPYLFPEDHDGESFKTCCFPFEIDAILETADADMDNYSCLEDCDDSNPAINPGAIEICDGIDNNCDGQIDEGLTPTTYYVDNDSDGYGDPNNSIVDCSQPAGTVLNSQDCNDNNSAINPGTTEVCDEIDNNCNGQIDEGLLQIFYFDIDEDGFGDPNNSLTSCTQPVGTVTNNQDCDDSAFTINPDSTEICDGIDNNCDGQIDVGLLTEYFIDDDADGFGDPNNSIMDCSLPMGYIENNQDCNDSDFSINPEATEICDGIDNNCDGQIDEGFNFVAYFADLDMDGFGDPNESLTSCTQPNGYVLDNTDCNDGDVTINPDAIEICDGLDNNCNGQVDEGLPFQDYFTDNDLDGYGDPLTVVNACAQPAGTVTLGGDCDDMDITINPGATDIPNNGIDEDCDGSDAVSATHELAGASIDIYPNPTSGKVFISVNSSLDADIEVFDLTGKKILRQTHLEINLNQFQDGLYLLRIVERNSKAQIVERIFLRR